MVSQSRTIRNSGVVPWMFIGTQFLLAYTTCPRPRTMGATAFTFCTSRMIASKSSGVSVMELPVPKLTPPDAAVPGSTISVLAPMLANESLIALADPAPISTIAITAATPITMPSVVSTARVMFRCSARRPVIMVLNARISRPSLRWAPAPGCTRPLRSTRL